ncbi:MAG TPA: phosphopentomutase [Atribacteraceae bacterium]|nr:phosphopentomutase [Atribacteraceae bacterium]
MRILIALLDGVGMGELPDAAYYNDRGSHTLRNTARAVGGLHLPVLASLGLGLIDEIPGVPQPVSSQASYGKMLEQSPGKDTTTGHWEIAGLILDQPFPLYPEGFPNRIIDAVQKYFGKPVLGNVPASGTDIIARLGNEHLRTGAPIVYTSADSVFQVAAHVAVIPPEELYRFCEYARRILTGKDAVARVIARPFEGNAGNYVRTGGRRDYSLPPPARTLLDVLVAEGKITIGVGKIKDIFANRGVTRSYKTSGNRETFAVFRELANSGEGDLVWANFNDFDSLYGHRNDPRGFAKAIEEWDRELAELLEILTGNDVLLITSDHGCDPTFPGTDHTREYAPLLMYAPTLSPSHSLGVRKTFADIAATASCVLNVSWAGPGTAFFPA